MKMYPLKCIGIFMIGLSLEVAVSATIPLQTEHWTYILAGTAYLLLGMLCHKYQFDKHQKILLLLPLILIKLFGVAVNKFNIPFLFPFTFLISLSGFFLGHTILKKQNVMTCLFFGIYLCAIYVIGFIVSPKIIYERNVTSQHSYPQEKITTWGLLDLKGKDFSFENVQGKVVLLNFTWKNCGQCIQKQPFIEVLQQKYKSQKNLVILEVDLGKYDTIEEAIIFSKKDNNSLQWVYDPENKLAKKLLFEGAPHEVLIDKDGQINYISAGFNRDIALIYVNEISHKIDEIL